MGIFCFDPGERVGFIAVIFSFTRNIINNRVIAIYPISDTTAQTFGCAIRRWVEHTGVLSMDRKIGQVMRATKKNAAELRAAKRRWLNSHDAG